MPNLPFVVDRRGQFPGKPVTHALIVGVGQYKKMGKLPAGAHTAAQIALWLMAKDQAGVLPAPLETLTLLLSPMPSQKATIDALVGANLWADATGANIEAGFDRWRALMQATETGLVAPNEIGAGLAFYYFGGHGADMLRADPVGFAVDADQKPKPYVGVFDHQEQREQTLLTPNGQALPTHPTRCVFLYDCCRRRKHSSDFNAAVKLKFGAAGSIAGIRPFLVVNATSVTFSAWEPVTPIALPPMLPLPLSYFGHAWLNVAEWCLDLGVHPSFTWQTRSNAVGPQLRRAMNELSALRKLRLAPPNDTSSAQPFTLLHGHAKPEVEADLRCDPAGDNSVTDMTVAQRVGQGFSHIQSWSAPWPQHPYLSPWPSAVLKLTASIGGKTTAEQIALIEPSLTPWRWIVRNGAIEILDPGA